MNDLHEKPQLNIPVVTNRYSYKQPDWCKYPNALEGQMGCWSLMDLSKDGLRTKISKDFCKGCDECSL